MDSANNNYALRSSANPHQFERPALLKRLPSITRIDQEKDPDIYVLSQKGSTSEHTYLSLDRHRITPVAPETYVSNLVQKSRLPDPALSVAPSSVQGSGVFSSEGKTFLEHEILSSYSKGAKFAFRLKHHDWVDDRRTSCFLAFVIGEDNQIHPVSQYQFILWTHVRVQWKHRKDIQLGILPADRPIRMINHQKAGANAEMVTVVDPAIYQFMAKERGEGAALVPVVGIQNLLDACSPDAPLPVQALFQAKKHIGPASEELFFDYFEADANQEEFDPTYEFIWIHWNQRMRKRIEQLTQRSVSESYAPPFCSANPSLAPEEKEALLHNRLMASHLQAHQGSEGDLEEFIRAFVRHWRYHHPQMPLVLTNEMEPDNNVWKEDTNASVHLFYTELMARLDGKIPVPDKHHNQWSIKELGDYLMNSDLFDQETYDRLINPEWLRRLSKKSNSNYKFLLKRYVRQHLADYKNTVALSKVMIQAGLPDVTDQEILTLEKLNSFIDKYKLYDHESLKKLARAAITHQAANHTLRRLIARGHTEAAKALVTVFIKEFRYTIKTLVKGPLHSLCITGDCNGKRTSISQLVDFINTHLPTKAVKLIKDPLLLRVFPSSDNIVRNVSDQRLRDIWNSISGESGDAGRKTREEMLKEKFLSGDLEILIWFECYIRYCFTRLPLKNGGDFSPALISALSLRCPLTSLEGTLLARHVPAIEEAIKRGQIKWGKPLLLQVCAYLGINNLRLNNGHLLAVWVVYEMECPPDYPLTDRHAKQLHPAEALTIPSDDGAHDPQMLPTLGQLVDWETRANCEKYSGKVRSVLARLWYTEPLNQIIKEQLKRDHFHTAGYLNATGIPAPDGAKRWTVESLSEHCLRFDLSDHYIEFVRPVCKLRGGGAHSRKRKNRIDKRHFSVFIAEHLPYCWFLCPRQIDIPEGLENKVNELRQKVESEIKQNPDNYEDSTLVPLARGGFISASNEMIKRLVPAQPSDGLRFIHSLRTPGIYIWYNNEWHWPTYPGILKAMTQGELVSKERIALYERMLSARQSGQLSTRVAGVSSSTVSDFDESDDYDSHESDTDTRSTTDIYARPLPAKKPRLMPRSAPEPSDDEEEVVTEPMDT